MKRLKQEDAEFYATADTGFISENVYWELPPLSISFNIYFTSDILYSISITLRGK